MLNLLINHKGLYTQETKGATQSLLAVGWCTTQLLTFGNMQVKKKVNVTNYDKLENSYKKMCDFAAETSDKLICPTHIEQISQPVLRLHLQPVSLIRERWYQSESQLQYLHLSRERSTKTGMVQQSRANRHPSFLQKTATRVQSQVLIVPAVYSIYWGYFCPGSGSLEALSVLAEKAAFLQTLANRKAYL